MSNLKSTQLNSPYNEEPVYYCKSCLSLYIQIVGDPEEDNSFCVKCNRTDIGVTDISTWREMWKERYGDYPENN